MARRALGAGARAKGGTRCDRGGSPPTVPEGAARSATRALHLDGAPSHATKEASPPTGRGARYPQQGRPLPRRCHDWREPAESGRTRCHGPPSEPRDKTARSRRASGFEDPGGGFESRPLRHLARRDRKDFGGLLVFSGCPLPRRCHELGSRAEHREDPAVRIHFATTGLENGSRERCASSRAASRAATPGTG
jgi:hypothetical protein